MGQSSQWRPTTVIGAIAGVALLAVAAWLTFAPARTEDVRTPPAEVQSSPGREAVAAGKPVSHEQVVEFCGACHVYPPPDVFPKHVWPTEVHRGFGFFRDSKLTLVPPDTQGVVDYYTSQAPEELSIDPAKPTDSVLPVTLRRRELSGTRPGEPSAIANVALLNLTGGALPDLLACEMAKGELLIRRAGETEDRLTTLATALSNPAHVEVVDLDADGVKDLLVANLGTPVPSNVRLGSVIWLRGRADGTFEKKLIASGLGRVCDIQAADFDGDHDLDLIVAVFGWRTVGEILYVEQRPGQNGKPEFVSHRVDDRHGTIHVPVTDLNNDGRPDFVALISQEFETVVAFLNVGEGKFSPKTLYTAPHPTYGYSGMQLVDLDGNGTTDILLTNGDAYDSDLSLLRPYHGVAWLRNPGDESPFEVRSLGSMLGAYRAVAGDLDGDADLDIVATSFLAEPFFGKVRREVAADAVVMFEQTSPGDFVRHVIERETCDYPTVTLGDFEGDGDLDIIAGTFRDFRFGGSRPMDPTAHVPGPVVIWENLGSSTSAGATDESAD